MFAVRADIDVVVNLRNAEAVSEDPPSSLRNYQYMSQMDNSDVFVALCTPGTFSPDHEGVCHDCTVCRPGEQFEKLACIPVRDRACANCTLCSDKEIELCQCSIKTTQCVTGDRVCVKVVPTSVTLTIDLTATVVLTSRQQTMLKSGMATGYADWLGEQFGIDPATIELVNFVRVDQLNYKATFTFLEVYGDATVARIKASSSAFFQGGLVYTFGSSSGRRRLLGSQDEPSSQAGRKLLGRSLLQTYFIDLKTGNSTFSCNASESACTEPFTEFQLLPNGTGCSGICAIMCPLGYGAATGGAKCEMCAAGYFKNFTGFDLCTECPAGSRSPQGSNSSAACVSIVATTTSTDPLTSNLSDATTTATATSPPQAQSLTTSPPPSSSAMSTTTTKAATPLPPPQTTSSSGSSSTSSSGLSSPTQASSQASQATSPSLPPSPPWTSSGASTTPPPSAPASSAPPPPSPQTTQGAAPPPPSGGGGGSGGGVGGSNSAMANNANTDSNANTNTINPTLNSNSDSHNTISPTANANADSHASNTANNVITVNVPKGDPQPIFNRNIVTVVLPPAPMPHEYYQHDGKDDDDDYHHHGYHGGYMPEATMMNLIVFMIFFFSTCCFAAWLSVQCQEPISARQPPEIRHVIRYRLVRTSDPPPEAV